MWPIPNRRISSAEHLGVWCGFGTNDVAPQDQASEAAFDLEVQMQIEQIPGAAKWKRKNVGRNNA